MSANQEVIARLSSMVKACQVGVLATVISVEGSVYKREGAKMIIEPNGDTIGMISGGCLEADVVICSGSALKTGNSTLKRYELDEELVWGLGLGCPGTVEILLEPIGTSSMWQRLADSYVKSEPCVVCKIMADDQARPQFLLVTATSVYGDWRDCDLQEQAVVIAREKLSEQTAVSESISLNSKGQLIRVFFDVYFPPPRLFIFGAGHDAIPLAKYSSSLGFVNTIIDPREAYNNTERFPSSRTFILGEEKFKALTNINEQSYIVIMNHHLKRDMAALAFALTTAAPYVGVLGPRTRGEKILQGLNEKGITFTKEQLQKLHNPIGLDIGADIPEEIAISIMAEIIAFRNQHQGGFLRDHAIIHKRRQLVVKEQK